MRHIDLFSGIGGFALACKGAGIETIAHSEVEPFACEVYHHHFPESRCVGDIRKFDWREYEGKADIITGGFPCQPFSLAGKRKGKDDDRHLWPAMLEVVKAVRPAWVLGENVAGFVDMALDEVLSDLEGAGYEARAFVIPACAVNAPHRRDRCWIVAHSEGIGGRRQQRGSRLGITKCQESVGAEIRGITNNGDESVLAPKPSSIGCNDGGDNRSRGHVPADQRTSPQGEQERDGRERRAGATCQDAPDSHRRGHVHGQPEVIPTEAGEYAQRESVADSSDAPDTEEQGLERENATRKQRAAGCAPEHDTWANFPTTEPCLRRGDDGLSRRVDRLKSLGNAIVPQIAYQIIKTLEELEGK